jgi:hypothetical protein
LFQQLLRSESAPELLRVEAARRLAQFASPKQMERLVENWSNFGSREAWVKIGNFLFSRLAEQKNSELALEVARRLASEELLSPVATRVFAGFSSDSKTGERKPASVKAKVHMGDDE